MTKDPSFPWYASDWLGSNNRAMMSLEQQGAYLNLLCRQWTDPTCSLPDDPEALARLSGMDEGYFKYPCDWLRRCFPPHPELGGRIANERLLTVRHERDEFLEKCSKGGKKSAETRRAKSERKRTSEQTKGTTTALGSDLGSEGGSEGQVKGKSPSPSPSPSPKTKKPPLSPLGPLDSITYPAGMDTTDVRQAITAWLAYKQQRGETYKDPAGQIGLLLAMPRFNRDPATFVAAVNHSQANNWAGCFPPKDTDHGNQTTRPGQPVRRGGRVHQRDWDKLGQPSPANTAGDQGAEEPGGADDA